MARKAKTPLSARYQRCKKTELATFATNRGLHITNTSTNAHNVPTHLDYVRALKQADLDPSFHRFLDLPPELRNMIYKNLVIFENSWYCQPQILATSRQVNKEATSILYGDNLIEVKIYVDGIYAHGQRCGQYMPVGGLWPGTDFRSLAWPDFLRRVQHLRLAVAELSSSNIVAHMASVGNTLASLCSFLATRHELWSLRLDFQWLVNHGVGDGIESTLYSLRLLGGVAKVTVDGFSDEVTAPFIAEMCQPAAEAAALSLAAVRHPLFAWVRESLRSELPLALGKGVLSHGYKHGKAWEAAFLEYVDRVRVRHERAEPGRLSQTLRTEVEDVLRKGVDLRLRQRQQAKEGESSVEGA